MEKQQDVLIWESGAPKNKLFEEWFIARLDNGQKVVLKRLPEKYAYDFKTADDTYYKEFRIAKWMPFPESEFFSPTALALLEALEDFIEITKESRGVSGYHLNGKIAEWHEFSFYDKAIDAIALAKGK